MATLWEITDVNTYNDGDFSGIIHSIKWKCTVTNENGEASRQGSAILPKPTDLATFVSVDQVTEQMAKAWLDASFGENGKSQIEQSVEARISMQNAAQPSKPSWINS